MCIRDSLQIESRVLADNTDIDPLPVTEPVGNFRHREALVLAAPVVESHLQDMAALYGSCLLYTSDHTIRLRATTMSSPDIRAGVALLIAAMSADGRSVIQNVEQIDRGYQNIDGRLNAIGADIRRID